VQLEAVFAERLAELTSPDRLARELESARADLIMVELASVSLPSQGAARELILCVTLDGEDLALVAQRARATPRTERAFLADFPPELRARLLSTPTGAFLDPLAQGQGFSALRVLAKTEPTLVDSAVHARLVLRVRARAFSGEVATHVVWRAWRPLRET
jgi:hypothetical protein